MNNNFTVGEEVRVFFREHSIPTRVDGVVVSVNGEYVTVRATDGWEGEAGSTVAVPHWNAEARGGDGYEHA